MTPWTAGRVVALVALLAAGVVMYFNLASGGAASAPSTEQNGEARPANNAATYISRLNNDDGWRYGPPYIEDFSADAKPRSPTSPRMEYILDDEWRFDSPYYDDFQSVSARPLSKEVLAESKIIPDDEWRFDYPYLEQFAEVTGHSNVNGKETGVLPEDDTYTYSDLSESASVIERLERQIDSLLSEAARDPDKNTPQLNREIQRLDDQIDMLRFNAMKDTSGGSPSYHAQRAADSLEERLEVQRLLEKMLGE